MAAATSSNLIYVKMSKHCDTLCSLHIIRRDLVPERKFDIAFRAPEDSMLLLNALE